MPLTQQQLLAGASYQLENYATGDPIDQFTTDRPFARWLIANKVETVFGNGIFNEKVRYTNDSNYQNYTGDDEVTYNKKDTVKLAPYQHYEAHDGFTLNETELANNGIVITDDKNAVLAEAEKIQIVNKLKEGWTTLKEGFQENWDIEMHLDGTQDTKAAPALDLIVSTTPTTGVVGGLDASLYTWWRNNTNLGLSSGSTQADYETFFEDLEMTWRACMTYGGVAPDAIFCGGDFYDYFRKAARAVHEITISGSASGGVRIDPSTGELRFHGVMVEWDPTFDKLDDIVGALTYPWKKRCYFLNKRHYKMRPFKGRWMQRRKPERVYNRYTHYFAITSDYGVTTSKRNSLAVLSIA